MLDATMTPSVNAAAERGGTAVLRRLLIWGGPSLVHFRDGPRAGRVTRNNNACHDADYASVRCVTDMVGSAETRTRGERPAVLPFRRDPPSAR
jgi:hypothetical protein